MTTTTFEAFEMVTKATNQARLIRHPRNELRLVWIPKAEIVSRKECAKRPGYYLFEVPEWLAEKHDF